MLSKSDTIGDQDDDTPKPYFTSFSTHLVWMWMASTWGKWYGIHMYVCHIQVLSTWGGREPNFPVFDRSNSQTDQWSFWASNQLGQWRKYESVSKSSEKGEAGVGEEQGSEGEMEENEMKENNMVAIFYRCHESGSGHIQKYNPVTLKQTAGGQK